MYTAGTSAGLLARERAGRDLGCLQSMPGRCLRTAGRHPGTAGRYTGRHPSITGFYPKSITCRNVQKRSKLHFSARFDHFLEVFLGVFGRSASETGQEEMVQGGTCRRPTGVSPRLLYRPGEAPALRRRDSAQSGSSRSREGDSAQSGFPLFLLRRGGNSAQNGFPLFLGGKEDTFLNRFSPIPLGRALIFRLP